MAGLAQMPHLASSLFQIPGSSLDGREKVDRQNRWGGCASMWFANGGWLVITGALRPPVHHALPKVCSR